MQTTHYVSEYDELIILFSTNLNRLHISVSGLVDPFSYELVSFKLVRIYLPLYKMFRDTCKEINKKNYLQLILSKLEVTKIDKMAI